MTTSALRPWLQSTQARLWISAWLVYTFVVSALFIKFPCSPDDAVYDYIGWITLRGGTIYIDAADQNWPGMVIPHVISTWLFGNTLDAYRKLDCVVMLVSALWMAAFALRNATALRAALLIVPIYQAVYVSQSYWTIGQRDILAAPLLLVAADAHLRRLEGKSLRWSVLQGAMIAVATLIRPTMLLYAGLLGLADVYSRLRAKQGLATALLDQIVVLCGMCIVFGTAALVGLQSGALAAFWEIAIRYNLQVYSTHGPSGVGMLHPFIEMVRYWFWALGLAVLGWYVTWRQAPRAAYCLFALVITAVISFYVQGKGFGYHLGPLWPVMAMFMAAGVDWALSRASRAAGVSMLQRALAIGLCAFTVLALAKKVQGNLSAEARYYLGKASQRDLLAPENAGLEGFSLADVADLSAYVKATTPKDSYLLVWGRPMHVNFIAERRSPSNIASFAMFSEPRETFDGFRAWQAQFARDLQQKPPALICLGRGAAGATEYETLPESSPEPVLSDVLLRELKANYEPTPARVFGRVECRRRKTPS